MSNDNKTLADVQPGGRVRLGDQAERARFEAWAHAQSYRGGNIMADRDAVHPDVYADPIAQLTWKSWQAAVCAQPSPVGQGDARAIIEEFIQCATLGRPHGKLIAQAKDYLAARQPVGEPPMEMRICELRQVSLKPDRPYIFTVDANCANCRADAAYAMGHTDTRPAQAVDLGGLREILESWKNSDYPFSYEGQCAQRALDACVADLQGWLDSQAVGK